MLGRFTVRLLPAAGGGGGSGAAEPPTHSALHKETALSAWSAIKRPPPDNQTLGISVQNENEKFILQANNSKVEQTDS